MKNLLLNLSVHRVLKGVAHRTKTSLTARQSTLFAELVKSLKDEPLLDVTQYLDHVVRNSTVQMMEGLCGELGINYWENSFREWQGLIPPPETPSTEEAPSGERKVLPAGSTVDTFHHDQHVVLMPVNPDTGLPTDYEEGTCGTFKIVQESGAHVRDTYDRLFNK